MSRFEARNADQVTHLMMVYGKESFVKAYTQDGKDVYFEFDLPSRTHLREYLDLRDQVWDAINWTKDDYAKQKSINYRYETSHLEPSKSSPTGKDSLSSRALPIPAWQESQRPELLGGDLRGRTDTKNLDA